MSKTTNIGAVVDAFVFGRPNPGHWATLNFITSTATTSSECGPAGSCNSRLARLQDAHHRVGRAGKPGRGPGHHPWNPIVKRICTTSFTLYSTGWVLLMLLGFYWLVEVRAIASGPSRCWLWEPTQSHLFHRRGAASWLDRAVGVLTLKFEWIGDFAPVASPAPFCW